MFNYSIFWTFINKTQSAHNQRVSRYVFILLNELINNQQDSLQKYFAGWTKTITFMSAMKFGFKQIRPCRESFGLYVN